MKAHNYSVSAGVLALGFGLVLIAALPEPGRSELVSRGTTRAAEHQIAFSYGKVPLSFEINAGQADPSAKFVSRGRGYNLLLTDHEAVLSLRAPIRRSSFGKVTLPQEEQRSGVSPVAEILRIALVGSDLNARVVGLDELPGKSNYFIGNDRSKWRTNVPTYAKVKYEDVYPGVDLVYYGNQRQMEYDFVIAPNADPTVIAFDLANLSRSETGPWIDGKGDLVISTAAGEVRFHKPVVYQSADNSDKRLVEGKFVLKGEKRVAFEVAEYDRTKTLVIDPVLVYSTPLAGNDEDDGNGIAVDAAGSAYVTGFTVSTVFPTTAGVFNSSGPGAFVTKFSPDGTSLVYSTFIGSGTGGSSIAVDGSGSAYITGSAGDNLPLVNPAQTNYGGNQDAFLAKLNADGSTLLYSTYLGGSASDEGSGIAILGPGSALVTGKTVSTDFPTFNALQSASAGADDAFVAKIDTTKVLAHLFHLPGWQQLGRSQRHSCVWFRCLCNGSGQPGFSYGKCPAEHGLGSGRRLCGQARHCPVRGCLTAIFQLPRGNRA